MMVVVWVYGIMGYTGYNINAQTVSSARLSLGLGVDYAVHFTTRLEEEAEHHPFAPLRNGWQNQRPRRVEPWRVLL